MLPRCFTTVQQFYNSSILRCVNSTIQLPCRCAVLRVVLPSYLSIHFPLFAPLQFAVAPTWSSAPTQCNSMQFNAIMRFVSAHFVALRVTFQQLNSPSFLDFNNNSHFAFHLLLLFNLLWPFRGLWLQFGANSAPIHCLVLPRHASAWRGGAFSTCRSIHLLVKMDTVPCVRFACTVFLFLICAGA